MVAPLKPCEKTGFNPYKNMKPKILFILILGQFTCSLPGQPEQSSEGPEFIVHGTPSENSIRVSMIELICNPMKFTGKYVNVQGIILFGGGEGPDYLMFDTYGLKDNANVVNLAISEELEKKSSIFSGERVTVEGKFYCIELNSGGIGHRSIDVEYVRMLKVPKKSP